MKNYNDDRSVENLEEQFGDPWDNSNPVGFNSILNADEQNEMLIAGEKMLDKFNLNAEFVPVEYGGRLKRIDHLICIMRSIYRHDPCLGLGYGASSLIASVNIWTAGNLNQRIAAADLLLRNRKIACSYYELSHGNDLARVEFEAIPKGGLWLLNGSKQVTTNLKRADAIVLFARTALENGSRSHTQFFIDKSSIPSDRINYLPRFNSVGMRGVQLGGIEFHNCPVEPSNMLGAAGSALEVAIKSFQITRTVLPGMFMGILDTGLRVAIRYAYERWLYGNAVAEIPHVRRALVETFIDLIICDCICTVVARAIHILPQQTCLYSPAVKFIVPKILIDAMNRLSILLGANFYLRDGQYAIFQKLLRDLKPSGFGHVARVVCQMTMLPQLPRLAKHSWLVDDTVPEMLFFLEEDLPSLSFQNFSISAGNHDPIIAGLFSGLRILSKKNSSQHQLIRQLVQGFISELKILKEKCVDLPLQELSVMASPETYDLTRRYANILVASACFNVWLHSQNSFLRNPAWLLAALNRLNYFNNSNFFSMPSNENYLFSELIYRYDNARSFDVFNNCLPGWQPSSKSRSIIRGIL